jgi:hypothetical protein
LTQDEWVELNNKEFSNYPSVRTLDGMCHQGNYIGMTQRRKQFFETVYSSGSITEREVYYSGTGAKRHGQQETKLLWAVLHLYSGNCVPPMNDNHRYLDSTLEHGTISGLEKQLTMKLNRTQLDREARVNRDNDAVSRLFNSVHHIYNRINISKKQEQEVVGTHDVPEDIVDTLDKVMDYEHNDDGKPNFGQTRFQ